MPSKSVMVQENNVSDNKRSGDFLEYTKVKEENFISDDKTWDFDGSYEENSDMEKGTDESDPMTNLPLEVITTVEPSNLNFPSLKNMSNGVLTHRNIFTELERDVLRNIVEKYRSIVDTRRRTRETYLEKQTVWQYIVEEFNSSENVMVRTEKELKKCWDNMKYRARLAEKEQKRADNFTNILKVSHEPYLNNNNIHSAIEKYNHMQSSTVEEGFISLLHQDDDQRSSEDGYQADSRDESDQDTINDDEQPLLKKARQESPKLSSILLGETKKKTKTDLSQYTIPTCTKVSNIRKKPKKPSNPIDILPKGLNSCVSIMNIPNPNLLQAGNEEVTTNGTDFTNSFGAITLGGGITIAPQKLSTFSNCSDMFHVKPLPNLRKMLSPKNNINKSKLSYNLKNNLASTDYHDSDLNNASIEKKILLQRLEFDEEEHKIKMKILEKQLHAYNKEALYWELKVKLVENEQNKLVGKLVNGSGNI